MKRWVRRILILVLILLVLLAVGALLFRIYVKNRIMDNGMEWGERMNGEPDYPLTGAHTYVDNGELFPVLLGTWQSDDGRWSVTLTPVQDDGFDLHMVLTCGGEMAMACDLDYVYFLPRGLYDPTELRPKTWELGLTDGSGNSLGTFMGLYYEEDYEENEGDRILTLTVLLENGTWETATLIKQTTIQTENCEVQT